jgi:carbon monoxide dehydrogenase subunit G
MNLEFRSSRKIDASPEIIWMVISDPRQWPAFVDRIQVINAEGDHLSGTIVWKERDFAFDGRVTCRAENERFIAVFDVTHGNRTDRMTVAFLITASGKSSTVSEEIDMDIQVPPWLGLLVRFISRFGRAQESTNLDRLADLVEGG